MKLPGKVVELLRIILSQLQEIEDGWSLDELMQPIEESIKQINELIGPPEEE